MTQAALERVALRVGYAMLVAAVVLLAVVLCGNGCVGAPDIARRARTANDEAARTLDAASAAELLHLRSLWTARAHACEAQPDDDHVRDCRRAGADAIFVSQAPVVEKLKTAVAAQHALADALTAYDACKGERVCAAGALAAVERALPGVLAWLAASAPAASGAHS